MIDINEAFVTFKEKIERMSDEERNNYFKKMGYSVNDSCSNKWIIKVQAPPKISSTPRTVSFQIARSTSQARRKSQSQSLLFSKRKKWALRKKTI